MASDSDDENTIFVRVYINKQYELTEDIDSKQDIWKLTELEENSINLESLREDIPIAFRKTKTLKPLFKDKNKWQWKIYAYDATNASLEIEDDDDLQTEIDEYGGGTDTDNDDDEIIEMNDDIYLKLRVVFCPSIHPSNPVHPLPETDISSAYKDDNKEIESSEVPGILVTPEKASPIDDDKKNDDEPISNTNVDDMNEVEAFLKSIGLKYYYWSFEEQGCSQMASLKFVNNETLSQVFGIHNNTKRKMILNGIRQYFSSSSKEHAKNQKENKKIMKNDQQNTDANSNDIAQCAECQTFGAGKIDANDHRFYCINCWESWDEGFEETEEQKQNDHNKTNKQIDEEKENEQQKNASDSKASDVATEIEENKENDEQKVPRAAAVFRVSAAMDFGTDGVGLAYSINDDETKNTDKHLPKIINHSKYVSWKHKDVLKQKAVILLDQDLNFIQFGKDAKKVYIALSRAQKHKYYLFERFKMSLYEHHISSNRKIQISNELKAANGKIVKAEIVFIAAFKYLKSEAIIFLKKLLKKTNKTINGDEIQWIITVPAIWNDKAKYKMRCWAVKSGLIDGYITNQCVIRYEPDCASLSLQYEMYGQTVNEMNEIKRRYSHLTNESVHKLLDKIKFKKGDKYVLVDAGGGTVDIARHEVLDEFSVKEIGHPSGGPWGSTYIDQEYKKLLNVLFDESLMNLFKENSPNVYVEMIDNFQQSKEIFYEDEDEDTFLDVRLPNEFMQFLEEKNFLCETFSFSMNNTNKSNNNSFVGKQWSPRMIGSRKTSNVEEDERKQNIPLHYQHNLPHKNMVKLEDDKLRINSNIWESMFDHVIDPIIHHTKNLFMNHNFKYLCLVGGFSCSKYFQYRMQQQFGLSSKYRLKFIVPLNPNLAVVQGAAYFGKRKNYIKARVLKYTYGCICRMLESTAIANGVPQEHIMKYRKLDKLSGQYYVKNCVNVIARKNETIETGQIKRHETQRKNLNSKYAKTRIFVSDMEHPTVLSHGWEQNSLKIKFDKNDKSLNVDVEFYFFDTTIKVYAYKENTPNDKEEIQLTYEQEIDAENFDEDI